MGGDRWEECVWAVVNMWIVDDYTMYCTRNCKGGEVVCYTLWCE